MPFQITTTITCFLLPGDGAQAEAEFLRHLADPSEMYIIAYGFTLQPMIDQFLANHVAGDPLQFYLDHSQASGMAEKPQLKRLVDAGIEVTIGTSPEGSQFICHTNGIVCLDPTPCCWEGSVNVSVSGWHQLNTAMSFSSEDWRDVHAEATSESLLESVPTADGIPGRPSPRLDGPFGRGLLLVRAPQQHPVSAALEHLVQVVDAADMVAQFGAPRLDDERGRIERFVSERDELRGPARGLEFPRMVSRAFDRFAFARHSNPPSAVVVPAPRLPR